MVVQFSQTLGVNTSNQAKEFFIYRSFCTYICHKKKKKDKSECTNLGSERVCGVCVKRLSDMWSRISLQVNAITSLLFSSENESCIDNKKWD